MVKHADLLWMKEVGLQEITYNEGIMSNLAESSGNIRSMWVWHRLRWSGPFWWFYIHCDCNTGGIDSKTHSTRSIPSKYPSNLSRYRTWYWTYTRTNSRFTSKLHSGSNSHFSRINVEMLSNQNILLRLVLRREKVALYTIRQPRGLYTSFLCTLTSNSNYAFL